MNQHSIGTESISLYMPSRPTHTIQSMALGISANASIDNNNSPGNNSYFTEIQMDDGKWTRHQTQVLIDTWKEHKDILLSTASSSAEHFRVWKLIATEVNKFAPPKSLQQCKKKFRNIRYICKMAMNNNKQENGKKHYPMFYSDFLEIIAETERIKEGIKTESPNVEILHENSAAENEIRSYNSSPPQEENLYENQSGHSPTELTSRRSEDYNDENRSQGTGVNTSDGSYNNSPQSRECEEYPLTASSNLPNPAETGDRGLENTPDLRNGTVENENGHNRIGERLSNYYSRHDSMYPSIYSRSDHMMRKHKNIDVSIMGHGYPTTKRMRKAMDFYTSPPPAPYKYSPRSQRGYPPTMATISANSYPYTLNAHYSTTPPLIRPISTPKDSSPPPRYVITSTTGNMTAPPSLNDVSFKESNSSAAIGDENVQPLKSSPDLKTVLPRNKSPRKDITIAESLNFYNQRFIDIQERQTELFNDMLCRHEQFLLRLLQQQREAAEEAQKRDREFMLKLIEMCVKH